MDGRLPSSSFQDQAPKEKGLGKWSTSYGYRPDPATVGNAPKDPPKDPPKAGGGG